MRLLGRRINGELLAVSFAVAVGVMLIGIGVNASRTGPDALGLPDEIEAISPTPNDKQVLRQTEIVVDLAANHEAALILDGVELTVISLDDLSGPGGSAEPGQQVELPATAIWDPGNFVISFRPTEGAEVEEYHVGEHTATVLYWKIEEGRAAARSFTWTFEVL